LKKAHGLTSAVKSTARRISGAEPADVQHQNIPDAAGQLERGLRETNLPDGKTNQGACRPMTARSISPMRRCSSKPPSRSWALRPLPTEAQYQAVLKVLRDQHGLIHRYWHDTTVQMSDFKNEGVVASSAWPYQANGLKAKASRSPPSSRKRG
jgi:hypothetical protein